ncbi:helix-turn-helix domain-containing protein [Microbacterium aurugineum]|uniref:Transposase n=1 Tax=Microbacterium aurugineum TaxID=2851642 RepID=A0ABY4IWW1_9MICO|nr:hypothetical protein [Microbacterium aurugineum]UPL17251.1 hypothetical protein KV397_05510 [Microbacterium aurugineum]
MSRPSSILSHKDLRKIEADLASGEPVPQIAKRHHVSQASLYRYKTSAMGRVALRDSQAASAGVSDLLSALTDSLRDADTVRRTALAMGRNSEALRAAQTVNQLTQTLSKGLGIDSLDTAERLASDDRTLYALVSLIHETPEIAQRMSLALSRQGYPEIAGDFEDLFQQITTQETTA